MISAEFSLPIIVDPRPEDSIALGAARLAVECLQARQAALLPIPLVQMPVVQEPAVESPVDDSPVVESNTPESTVPAMFLSADPRPSVIGDAMPAAPRTPLGTDDVDPPPEVTKQDAARHDHRTSLTAGPVPPLPAGASTAGGR